MTSNLGSEALLEKLRSQTTGWTKESILGFLDPILKAHFRPEFLNRLDDILPFLPLQEHDMEKIVIIQLKLVRDRLAERHVTLLWDKDLVAYLAKEGYDPFFGARPLKRMIQNQVVNILSVALLKGEIPAESTVELKLNKKEGERVGFEIKSARP